MKKKRKIEEITLKKEYMVNFAEGIDKDTSNAEIFIALRKLYDETLEHNLKITNLGSLYWFLIDHREKLRAA